MKNSLEPEKFALACVAGMSGASAQEKLEHYFEACDLATKENAKKLETTDTNLNQRILNGDSIF